MNLTKVKDLPKLIGNLDLEVVFKEIHTFMWSIVALLLGGFLVALILIWIGAKYKIK